MYQVQSLGESEQKSVNEQLLFALQESQSLVDAIKDYSLVSIADPQGNITYVNDLFVQASGYSSTELLGKNHRMIHSTVHAESFWQTMWNTVTAGKVWRDVVCNRAKSGELFWVDTQITPVFNAARVIEHYVAIRTDITKLVNATEAAKAATVAKSQFLANMSHEVKTPMNAIMGMLKLLQSTELTVQQQDYVTKASGASNALLSLLNDLLNFSKMETSQLTLDLQPLQLDHLVHDLSVCVSPEVGEKPLVLHFETDPAIPKVLLGDAGHLHQVLLNLCGNAIKFTVQGEVRVAIKRLSQTGAETQLRFSVQDSGIGIAPENLEAIFSGFSQVDASRTRRFGGTGLGLLMARKLVALMGGELAVTSVLGQGSTFSFTLTLRTTDQRPGQTELPVKAETPKPLSLEGMRLLVVEDNLINQLVARELLKAQGAQVVIAVNGQLGVEAVAAADPPFDAVLMDLQMPVMDGFEATRVIRTELGLANLPIIALTANAMSNDRAQCLAAGMNEHVGKPFNMAQLVEVLLKLTASPTPGAPGALPSSAKEGTA
jgi:PAS domain S-box-containing protein